jgi:hypothetical protein
MPISPKVLRFLTQLVLVPVRMKWGVEPFLSTMVFYKLVTNKLAWGHKSFHNFRGSWDAVDKARI